MAKLQMKPIFWRCLGTTDSVALRKLYKLHICAAFSFYTMW